MADQHRATPEQWEELQAVSQSILKMHASHSCLLELRDRVEALEAGQEVRSGPESPLVARVGDAIAAEATSAGIVSDRLARVAIKEITDWLESQGEIDATELLRGQSRGT